MVNEDDEENQLEGRSDVFNMSLAVLRRIDALINSSAVAHKSKNYPEWFEYLEVIKQQISYKFTQKQKEAQELFADALEGLSFEFEGKMRFDAGKNKYVLRLGEDSGSLGVFSMLLESYERFLLSCMDSYGWLTIAKEESGLF